tara:strand:+ start:4216 stop:6063 length:1848 start_codon:yes stop_codon:yes gene_type:complete
VCGIVGYTGLDAVEPILLQGLEKLEYRGYDSAGVGLLRGNSIEVTRASGKLSNLASKFENENSEPGTGIGHTRWATHGAPTSENAHPHQDPSGRVAIVHNGIVENWKELRAKFATGEFSSDTDSEVLAHMIAALLAQGESLVSAVRRTLNEAAGAFSLVILDSSQPDVLIAARKGNAGGLVVGLADDGTYVASDMSALLTYTRKFFFLEPGEIATLKPSSVTIYSEEGREVTRQPYQATHDLTEVGKGQYPHYMMKEIYEQSDVLVSSLQGRYNGLSNTIDLSTEFEGSAISKDRIQGITRCLLVGMGTSMHACMVGRHYLERFGGIPTEVDNAAEFRYRRPLLDSNTLVISVTQSGETVDTLAAMDEAKRADCLQITICNTPGAQSTRLADLSLLLGAGAEISVASTKTLLASIMALHAVSLFLGKARETLTSEIEAEQVVNALQLPSAVSTVLGNSEKLFEVARKYAASEHFLFLGRGLGYPVALEGALKLKEVSYIHAEGYSAGEMKHGPIALVNDAMPTVAVCTRGDVHEKMLSNVEQIKARGGRVISLVTDGDDSFDKLADDCITLPDVDPALGPIPSIVALQLLAYGIARERGLDIDQPRNLAKTVTVE